MTAEGKVKRGGEDMTTEKRLTPACQAKKCRKVVLTPVIHNLPPVCP